GGRDHRRWPCRRSGPARPIAQGPGCPGPRRRTGGAEGDVRRSAPPGVRTGAVGRPPRLLDARRRNRLLDRVARRRPAAGAPLVVACRSPDATLIALPALSAEG